MATKKWSFKLCGACFRQHLCVFHPIWVFGQGVRGPPNGLLNTKLVQFFTPQSSKIQVSETYFDDLLVTHNDHPSYVKHVLGIYVFFTLLGYCVRGGGGGLSQWTATQPACAAFGPVHLSKMKFPKLIFLISWPLKMVIQAMYSMFQAALMCFPGYLGIGCVCWGGGGGGFFQWTGTQPALAVFHPVHLKT